YQCGSPAAPKLVSSFSHPGVVKSVAWSSNGEYLAGGCMDGTVQIWDATDQEGNIFIYHGHTEMVAAVAWAPDGKRLVSASREKLIQVWEAATGRLVSTAHSHARPAISLAWSPDGQR